MGGFAIGGVLLLVLCALGGLAAEAGSLALLTEWNKPGTGAIIRFTLWQSALSTLISVGLAIPLARALARRRHFFGRRFIIRVSSLSLIVPTIVAVLGMVALHGRNGWLNQLLAALGFARRDYLYGIGGILLAHVFFNLPLATRILLNGLLTLPQHSWNIAQLYGMRPLHIFRHIEWPVIRSLLGGIAGMVFLLCFTSFAIVLTLGGGPQSTTLEVAIYQAIRFDFDLTRAVALSLIQIGICGLLALLFFASGSSFPLCIEDEPGIARTDGSTWHARLVDTTVIALATIFLLSPLAAVLMKAAKPEGWSILANPVFWQALWWTLTIALGAGFLSCILALVIADTIVSVRRHRRMAGGAVVLEVIGALNLLVPPITLGTGLFLFFRHFTDALSLGPVLVVALNALLTLAFGIRILLPAVHTQRDRYDRLCTILGIGGIHRWRYVLWPALRQPITYALAVATTLAAGDMGVIALFGTQDLHTLPLLMYRLISNYHLAQAAVVAAVLCVLCFALFWLIENLGRVAEQKPHA